MRRLFLIIFCVLLAITAFANGDKGDAYRADLAKKIARGRTVLHPRQYVAYMRQGSLKHNVVAVAHRYGWRTVAWNVPDDYPWIGSTTIRGNSLQQVFIQILQKYPLQAQFYQGNRVLAIVPRNLP